VTRAILAVVALPVILGVGVPAQAPPPKPSQSPSAGDIDRDLLDVTVPRLHRLYAERTYTVTQVIQWHLARIDQGAPTGLKMSVVHFPQRRACGRKAVAPDPNWGVAATA